MGGRIWGGGDGVEKDKKSDVLEGDVGRGARAARIPAALCGDLSCRGCHGAVMYLSFGDSGDGWSEGFVGCDEYVPLAVLDEHVQFFGGSHGEDRFGDAGVHVSVGAAYGFGAVGESQFGVVVGNGVRGQAGRVDYCVVVSLCRGSVDEDIPLAPVYEACVVEWASADAGVYRRPSVPAVGCSSWAFAWRVFALVGTFSQKYVACSSE